MKDIKEFIEKRVNENIERSKNWEEKIQTYTGRMRIADSAEVFEMYKFERQQCIGKKNELLAVADFGKELLQTYFS